MKKYLNPLKWAMIAGLVSCEGAVLHDIPVKYIEKPIYICCEDMAEWEGKICCISGEDRVEPGSLHTYEYGNNLQNPEINWAVISGSIRIIEGQKSSSILVEFGDDFTNGTIKASGFGAETCEKEFKISRKVESEIICGQKVDENSGRIACFYGPEVVSPGDTVSYRTESNLNNPDITWSVNSGSIELIEGENQETATFVFGDDFSAGVIRIFGFSRAFPFCESYTCFIEVSSEY